MLHERLHSIGAIGTATVKCRGGGEPQGHVVPRAEIAFLKKAMLLIRVNKDT